MPSAVLISITDTRIQRRPYHRILRPTDTRGLGSALKKAWRAARSVPVRVGNSRASTATAKARETETVSLGRQSQRRPFGRAMRRGRPRWRGRRVGCAGNVTTCADGARKQKRKAAIVPRRCLSRKLQDGLSKGERGGNRRRADRRHEPRRSQSSVAQAPRQHQHIGS